MLDQAVAVLGFEADVSVEIDRMIHSNDAVTLLPHVLLITSPGTWRLRLFSLTVLIILQLMLLTDDALCEETSAPSEAETVRV